MAIMTGDRYLDHLVRFVDRNAGPLLDGTLTLKLNPVGLHYVHSRLDALSELESLLAAAPVDYFRAYVSDLGDHRALEHLRRILRLLPNLKVVSLLVGPTARDPTPVSLLPFSRLRTLELRGCDLSTSAARGLLELRHTLEKLICLNSTDALRHVFASWIVDVRDSPAWNRLTFVSCACNGLVLMDESLQLLPAVETLDLSRNQFAKVTNLRKCGRLQLLDVGFNHLRSILSLGEVSSRIIKLVLRNNALATLRGIENLKSLEGLDLSYNIISNFTELEILASLPCLQSLWLEGNPLCCARWYRAHVFSFFSHPEKLNLDEKGISTREFWERHIILAGRQKQPSGYGFYFPAKDDAEDEGGLNIKRKKYYRLASIEDEEKRRYCCSETEQESVSCDSDSQRRDENAISDSESEIVNLMNKVEYMKKERSVLWLREFKDWMDQTPEYTMDRSRCTRYNLDPGKNTYVKQNNSERLLGESSSFTPDLTQVSEGGSSSNILDSDLSFTDTYACVTDYYETTSRDISEQSKNGDDTSASRTGGISPEQKRSKFHSKKFLNLAPLEATPYPQSTTVTVEGDDLVELKINPTPLTVIDEIMGSRSSSIYPGSPPHYEEDILQRRLYLEEEFLQLSAESQSLASSDSDTSCSDDDSCMLVASIPELDHLHFQECTEPDTNDVTGSAFRDNDDKEMLEDPVLKDNSIISSEFYLEPNSGMKKCVSPNHGKFFLNNVGSSQPDESLSLYVGSKEKVAAKKKVKRRIISLSQNFVERDGFEVQKANGLLGSDEDNNGDREGIPNCKENYINVSSEESAIVVAQTNEKNFLEESSLFKTMTCSLNLDQDEFIKDFSHMRLADSGASETCQQAVRCPCIHQLESVTQESEVALLRSCKNKLYLLLIDAMSDGQENVSKVFGCHRLEELREVVIGLGMQALRVQMEGDSSYLFLPRTIEEFQDLLCLLRLGDSTASSGGYSLRSWEQVQVKLLEKCICGNLKMGIVMYSMLLWHDKCEGEPWVSRSLFVIEGCMLVCIENFVQFSLVTDNIGSSPPYYSLDSYCAVQDILELVVELKGSRCVTLSLNNFTSGRVITDTNDTEKPPEEESSQVCTWKLKWFSEERLLKFVAVVKAIYLGLTMSPLPVKCVS